MEVVRTRKLVAIARTSLALALVRGESRDGLVLARSRLFYHVSFVIGRWGDALLDAKNVTPHMRRRDVDAILIRGIIRLGRPVSCPGIPGIRRRGCWILSHRNSETTNRARVNGRRAKRKRRGTEKNALPKHLRWLPESHSWGKLEDFGETAPLRVEQCTGYLCGCAKTRREQLFGVFRDVGSVEGGPVRTGNLKKICGKKKQARSASH